MPETSTGDILQQAWTRFLERIGVVRKKTTEMMRELDEEQGRKKREELLSKIKPTS